ncbi:MAG: hypothetical protein ACKO50_03380 [Cyanobium sp.]
MVGLGAGHQVEADALIEAGEAAVLAGGPHGATRTSEPESAVGWLPGAAVIVYTKRLPSGLMKLVAFWPSG